MTREQQVEMATSLCDSLKREILKKIQHIPENWDGKEIRRWVGDYYNDNFKSLGDMSPKRKRDYNNDRMINPHI